MHTVKCKYITFFFLLDYFFIHIFRRTGVKILDFYEFTVPRMATCYYIRYFRMFPHTVSNLTEYLIDNESIQKFFKNKCIPMENNIHMTLIYLDSKITTLQYHGLPLVPLTKVINLGHNPQLTILTSQS